MSVENALEIKLERLFDDVFDMGDKTGQRVASTVVRAALLSDSEAKALMLDLSSAYERGLQSGYKGALYKDKNPFAKPEEKVGPSTVAEKPIVLERSLGRAVGKPIGRQVGLRMFVNRRGKRYSAPPEKFEDFINRGYWFANLGKTGIPEEYKFLLQKYAPPEWYKPPVYQDQRAPKKARRREIAKEFEEKKEDESFAEAQEELEPRDGEEPIEEPEEGDE
jgi:hypothetical protein